MSRALEEVQDEIVKALEADARLPDEFTVHLPDEGIEWLLVFARKMKNGDKVSAGAKRFAVKMLRYCVEFVADSCGPRYEPRMVDDILVIHNHPFEPTVH